MRVSNIDPLWQRQRAIPTPAEAENRGEVCVSMNHDEMVERSRDLRREMTWPERILWKQLRDRKLKGLKFRRQHVIGPYIVDFFCEEHQLVVELDGESHATTAEYDRIRQRWFEAQGCRVLRFGNDDVLKDLECELEAILKTLEIPIDK